MFAAQNSQSLQPESHRAASARLRIVRALRFLVSLGVAVGSAFAIVRIFFANAPFGGTSGLLALYGATVAVALGLTILSELTRLENTLSASAPVGRELFASVRASNRASPRETAVPSHSIPLARGRS